MQPTISISVVCTPEQLAQVQARVNALQADLYRLGVAFSVSTHHDPPPRPTMTLEEPQRDPQAVLAGFAQTEHSATSIPSWCAVSSSRWRSKVAELLRPGFRHHDFIDKVHRPADNPSSTAACVSCGRRALREPAGRSVERAQQPVPRVCRRRGLRCTHSES